MVKNTAARMRVTSAPMSPICLAKPTANSFSGWVLVSSGEFAKRRVDRGRDGAGLAWSRRCARCTSPSCRVPIVARLVEVGDVDQHHVGVAAHRRVLGVDDADQVELPVQARRRRLAWISELIGSFWPTFQPKRSTRRLPATAPVRVRRRPRAARRVDGELRVHRRGSAPGSTANTGKALLSFWYLAPNHSAWATPDHARHLLDPAQVRRWAGGSMIE